MPRARKLYRQALEVDPGHLQSIMGLGQLEARAGELDEALQVGQGVGRWRWGVGGSGEEGEGPAGGAP